MARRVYKIKGGGSAGCTLETHRHTYLEMAPTSRCRLAPLGLELGVKCDGEAIRFLRCWPGPLQTSAAVVADFLSVQALTARWSGLLADAAIRPSRRLISLPSSNEADILRRLNLVMWAASTRRMTGVDAQHELRGRTQLLGRIEKT